MVATYAIALYLRISVDDDIGNDESYSITNQRMYLTGFIEKSSNIHTSAVYHYCDDGYTGTNFNRPQFQKMIEDIKNGLINCIIVKDFSRLARNRIDITDFLTNFFPLNGVRFISVNDGFDSLYDDPTSLDVSFRNLINDLYSKDISEKVRSGVYSRMRQGNFIGSSPLYGYRIDNSGSIRKLVIDKESAAFPSVIDKQIVTSFVFCQNG